MGSRQKQVSDIVAQALAAPPEPHLKVGERYSISRTTPLMPRFKSAGIRHIDREVAQVKRLPPGTEIAVDRKKRNRGNPWYDV